MTIPNIILSSSVRANNQTNRNQSQVAEALKDKLPAETYGTISPTMPETICVWFVWSTVRPSRKKG